MRCKGCDYPLWDIAARACPECGLPFRPSDYDFAVNSVRFCCQHCGQAYYGTADRGHLMPSRFHCVSCARMIDMDEMRVLPREGVPESVSLPERMPWLERQRLGFWRGLAGTWARALGTPTRLADTIPVRGPDGAGGVTIGPALAYAMIFNIPYMVVGLSFLTVPAVLGAISGLGGTVTSSVIAVATSILSIGIGCVIVFLAWAILAHAWLRISGSAPAGLAGTVAALGYSSGVNFLSGMPCVGFMLMPIGMLWWAIAASLMAMRIQRASPLRAVIAFLVVPLVALASVAGGGILLIYVAASRTPAFATPPGGSAPLVVPAAPAPRTLEGLADRVAGACIAYHAREGSWPRSGLDLVRDGDLTATHLTHIANPGTMGSNLRAGGMRLDEIDLLLPDQLSLLADANANETDHPSGALRSGSVVFFTKGLSGAPDLSGVWIACAVPMRQGDEGVMYAAFADGSSLQLPMTQESVEVQNSLRRDRGLPELPTIDQWP